MKSGEALAVKIIDIDRQHTAWESFGNPADTLSNLTVC
jgi:hypothetical protein